MSSFPSYNITVNDSTTFKDAVETMKPISSNILIAGVFEKGRTNTIQQYYAGEVDRFVKEVGSPNYAKYGVGPDIAVAALDNAVDLGVMVVNLRPDDATCANVALAVRTKTVANVPETNAEGEALYLTPQGLKVTVAEGNTPIVRDMLESDLVKYTFTGVENDADLLAKLDALYDEADEDGYEIIPLIAFRYIGASAFGNQLYFRFLDKVSDVDGKVYYYVEIFNGETFVQLGDAVSFFPEASMYNQSLFIETLMKLQQTELKIATSIHYDKFIEKVSAAITDVDPMTVNLFDAVDCYYYRNAATSLDITKDRALVLQNGSNGTMTNIATAYRDFFAGDIVSDITSLIRYRIDFIPDLEYSDEVCGYIETFLKARNHTTNFRRIAGSKTFESAIAAYQANPDSNYNVSLIAGCQSGTMYNPYAKRTFRMPASYYDSLCYIAKVVENKGVTYLPFAGANVRWAGFDEDSMIYPKENDTVMKGLSQARVNFIKKDKESGGYLFTQHTRTKTMSDLTEFSNVMMVSSILYDLIEIIHANMYKFNDYEEVEKFKQDVQLQIQPTYRIYSTFVTVDVYKKGRYGEDKNTNVIKVYINFKDLFKNAEINLEITDKTLDEL